MQEKTKVKVIFFWKVNNLIKHYIKFARKGFKSNKLKHKLVREWEAFVNAFWFDFISFCALSTTMMQKKNYKKFHFRFWFRNFRINSTFTFCKGFKCCRCIFSPSLFNKDKQKINLSLSLFALNWQTEKRKVVVEGKLWKIA